MRCRLRHFHNKEEQSRALKRGSAIRNDCFATLWEEICGLFERSNEKAKKSSSVALDAGNIREHPSPQMVHARNGKDT